MVPDDVIKRVRGKGARDEREVTGGWLNRIDVYFLISFGFYAVMAPFIASRNAGPCLPA